MQIILNGSPYVLASAAKERDAKPPLPTPDSITIATLVLERELNPKQIAVEVNQVLIPREEFEQHELAEGDTVELVTLAGGG